MTLSLSLSLPPSPSLSYTRARARARFAGLPIIQPYRQPKKHAIPTVVQVNTRFLKCVHINIKLDNHHGYDCMQWMWGRNVNDVLGCVACRRWFWRQPMMIFPSIRRDRCSHAHPTSIYNHGEYMPPHPDYYHRQAMYPTPVLGFPAQLRSLAGFNTYADDGATLQGCFWPS